MSEETPPGPGDGQDSLPGTDYTKVKFVGMALDALDADVVIGDELVFAVRARCVGVGDDEVKDGLVRHVAKMKVSSVVLKGAAPPEDG